MKNKILWNAAAVGVVLAVIPANGGTPVVLTTPGADERYPDRAPVKDGR